MKIEVGMKCRQTKVLGGFDYVCQEFEVVELRNNGDAIILKCWNKGVGFGVDPKEFSEHFKIVEEKEEKEENKLNEVYTYEALPYVVNWKVTHNGETTYETTDSEEFTYKLILNGNATIFILNDEFKGVAKCLPTDTYDVEKGKEIAYLKAQIKYCKKKLKELSK